MPILTFDDFSPDRPDYQTVGSSQLKNVVPKLKTYGPMPALATYTSALAQRPQGGFAAFDPSGTVTIFAADANDLYRLASGTFSVVSKSAAAYSCPSDDYWDFAEFGNIVIATDGADTPQAWTLGTSSAFADLGGSPPTAKRAAVVRDFVVLGNLAGLGLANAVQWSAINNATSWPTIGTNAAIQVQSDRQILAGDGGAVKAIVGGEFGVIFAERSIWRMTYQGSPTIFRFDEVETGRGIASPRAWASRGPSSIWYLGTDGFYMFNGMASTPIGTERVDRFFYGGQGQSADYNPLYLSRTTCSIDPISKLIIWSYVSAANATGIPDHQLIYNYVTDRWSYAEQSVTFTFRSLSEGYTLEGLDAVSTNLDALPFSLDSRAWVGGALAFAGFDSSNKYGLFNGSNLAATITTTESQPNPVGLTVISNTRPIIDGGTPTVTCLTRNRMADTPVAGTTSVAMNANGQCPLRAGGRYLRFQMAVPAGQAWTHATGVEYEGSIGGAR